MPRLALLLLALLAAAGGASASLTTTLASQVLQQAYAEGTAGPRRALAQALKGSAKAKARDQRIEVRGRNVYERDKWSAARQIMQHGPRAPLRRFASWELHNLFTLTFN